MKSIFAGVALAATVYACSEPIPATPPKAIRAVTPTTLTGTAGAAVAGGVTVRVVDYSDRAVQDAKVTFTITTGDGSLSQRLVVTDAEGLAHTEWTLSPIAGVNELAASMFGIDSDSGAAFLATGNAASAAGIAITPRIVRIQPTGSTGQLTTSVADQFGNPTTGTTSYTSRNTSVATVSSTGLVTKVQAGQTWIIVTGQGFTDSALVVVLAAGDPPCTGISAMASLAVGEVKTTGFVDNGVCIPAASGEREYALVPYFNMPVPSAITVASVSGSGVKTTASFFVGSLRPRETLAEASRDMTPEMQRMAFDRRLRISERAGMPSHVASARQWYSRRATTSGPRASLAITTPAVGDQVELNIDDESFCATPTLHTGRVAAVTQKAVVIADLANAAGGFTDAEYAALGTTFDTLAYPVDIENFGEPTDIDNNGRVILFFTKAVNAKGLAVLGWHYSRDLLPKSGPLGSCPGSNVAEMLYLPVPDAQRLKSDVTRDVYATFGHELQHLINSSRRLYINLTAAPQEERWLNEGLSHVAEELMFYKVSGLGPRQNIGPQLVSAPYQQPYQYFLFQNFARYFRFTRFPDVQSPVGITDDDDDIETRGATWSFLRYAADHKAAANETAFWKALVNANSTGMQNLVERIGQDTRLVIRDWSLSNLLDDLVPVDAKYTQPSWNLRQVPGFQSPVTFQLTQSSSPVNVTTPVTLRAMGSGFMRFAVGTNQEAYVTVTGAGGSPLSRNVLLAIVRTK